MYIGIAVFALYHILYVAVTIYVVGNRREPRFADVAVILGAAAYHNNPSPVFKERINHGLWLYKQGYIKKLIFTGGKSPNAPFSESEVAKKYAIANQIPDEDILIEEYSRTTYENILYAADIINAYNFKTALLVSDPLHLKRAMVIAKDNHLTVYPSPTPTTQYKTLRTILPFWVREVLYYVLYEIEKYYGYILLYAVILWVVVNKTRSFYDKESVSVFSRRV
ncbi:MAG: YdcF family protein [Spirochaetaceae bacterium]|nr:YdcF family protein [Spirochaetaceae bacterium]